LGKSSGQPGQMEVSLKETGGNPREWKEKKSGNNPGPWGKPPPNWKEPNVWTRKMWKWENFPEISSGKIFPEPGKKIQPEFPEMAEILLKVAPNPGTRLWGNGQTQILVVPGKIGNWPALGMETGFWVFVGEGKMVEKTEVGKKSKFTKLPRSLRTGKSTIPIAENCKKRF